jgi:hypothetical protein
VDEPDPFVFKVNVEEFASSAERLDGDMEYGRCVSLEGAFLSDVDLGHSLSWQASFQSTTNGFYLW